MQSGGHECTMASLQLQRREGQELFSRGVLRPGQGVCEEAPRGPASSITCCLSVIRRQMLSVRQARPQGQ